MPTHTPADDCDGGPSCPWNFDRTHDDVSAVRVDVCPDCGVPFDEPTTDDECDNNHAP